MTPSPQEIARIVEFAEADALVALERMAPRSVVSQLGLDLRQLGGSTCLRIKNV